MGRLMAKYSYDPSGNTVSRTPGNILPPEIIANPVLQIAAPGDLVTFSVLIADASGVTFQWKFRVYPLTTCNGCDGTWNVASDCATFNSREFRSSFVQAPGSQTPSWRGWACPRLLLLSWTPLFTFMTRKGMPRRVETHRELAS